MDERRFRHFAFVSALLGVGVGIVATVFRVLWLAAKHALWSAFPADYWRIPISVGAGVVIGAIFYVTFYPGALSSLVQQFHTEGRVPLEENVPTIPAGWIGLIAGQNAGPEGVMSVVGGSFGTAIADYFEFVNSTKLLTLAGMGAGFGTILGAPIGGALLWLELPHKRGLEYYEAIIPTFIASFAGYLTEVTLGGTDLFPAWQASSILPVGPWQLALALGVGLLCIPFGAFYTYVFAFVGRAFRRWSPAVYVRTTVAGAAIGVLGYVLPLTYFYGGSKINEVLTQSLPLSALALTFAGTVVAASFTIHGNWLGGLIIPHMFMGALVGRAAAVVAPGLEPALGMLAGMAAFNSVVTGTPLSSALIAIALTDGASITPVFLASLTAFVASPHIQFLEEASPRSEEPAFHIRDD